MTDQTPGRAAAPAAEIVNLALSDLTLSPLNPRQDADPAGIAALAASIRTVGLMQNLSGLSREGGKVEIVAGGRRLRALNLLAETGDAPEFVPVALTSDIQLAQFWANTENSAREELHPADEVRAYFAMLMEGNATVSQVAAAFAVTEAHVRRRVRLGALPAPVLDALKAGEINLSQAQAMTISQDEDLILAALDKAKNNKWCNEHDIRAIVLPHRISGSDRRLKFVGLDAYAAAGGKSTADLFNDETILHSPDVLDRVFAEKLDAAAETYTENGWKWVRTYAEPQPNWSEIAVAARLYREEGELTEVQMARYDELAELYNGDALDEDGESELEALQIILEGVYTTEQRAGSGVLVYVDYAGEVRASEGIVLPEDADAAIAAGLIEADHVTPAKSAASGAGSAEAEKPALSQALVTDLQAMRNAAVQGALLDKPKLALDLLAFTMSERFGPIDMAFHPSNITPSEAEGFTPDPRFSGTDAEDEAEDDAANPFEAFRAKGEKHRNAVLALTVARCLKYGFASFTSGGRLHLFDAIEAEVKANIRQVWTPTAANFFGRVNAVYLEDLLADLTGCDRSSAEFRAFAGGKKKDKAATLERLFSDPDTQALWKIDAAQKARIDAWAPDGI
ncbi:ParB/RepB/Spo0J family partition protein [Paracoccus sulfuroxidans]|uniref:ParB family chromosome partitioning protein n=1 Tax=Paracoccus sulfuroxidans TaxID=384678 RepID=A0A562N6H6_9RHOB|nr:ParB/RepB/Spo0J family partition protein [Paracoccus sulfuroxidans]TWI27789.1 ParB family chromosome partitioning protein [Paracoccus sulfuroxidans]